MDNINDIECRDPIIMIRDDEGTKCPYIPPSDEVVCNRIYGVLQSLVAAGTFTILGLFVWLICEKKRL
jgi:hypothetical protein